jgi:hypothetical protein
MFVPKGHQQPHLSHLPRRQKRKPTEILPGSGVYVSLNRSEGGEWDVRVEVRAAGGSHDADVESMVNGDIEERNVLAEGKKITVTIPMVSASDSGMPHLSREQLSTVWGTLKDREPPKLLITTETEFVVDAVAIIAGYLSLCPPKLTPALEGPPRAPALSRMYSQTSNVQGPIQSVLSEIHDQGDRLNDTWQGVISRDGVEWLEDLLTDFQTASDEGSLRHGISSSSSAESAG